MARENKIYTKSVIGGINTGDKTDESSAELVKNMINKGGQNRKRNGHQNICTLTDSGLNGLRINGIYDYSYLDGNGQAINQKIVHAKNKLFKLDQVFGGASEIALPQGITLKDRRSQGFLAGERLWIVGAGDLLIYDGTSIKSAYEHENAYVPTTATFTEKDGIREKESPNFFTRKRANEFLGTSIYRESGTVNTFLLDEKIKYGASFLLEIKIRTRTSEEEADETTTSYIGIDSLGREVSKIVTLRYRISKILEDSHYYLTEPITDEAGNIIKLQIGEVVYSHENLPFGITIKNGREVCAALDVTAPIKGEANVRIEYIKEEDVEKDYLKKAEIVALANGDKGGEIMLVNFGDNKIYFTNEKIGFFYLQSKNEISLGTEGEKISAIVKLSDNLVGAFTKNSFYRIKFISSCEDGYEIISSKDQIGAYSQSSSAVVDYDCLVFNDMGIYGVSDYKSSSNVFSCLRQRSTRIDSLLEKYSKAEREGAQAISYNSRYYLFIGGDVYIADTRRKIKSTGAPSDAYEYDWWMWDNCPARIVYSDGEGLYFGTENGQIRKFTDDFCDVEKKEFKEDSLSLLLKDLDTYTEFIVPNFKNINFDIARAYLSSHKRLLSQRAVYENGTLYFPERDMFFDNSTVKLFEDDELEAYSKDGEFISSFKAEGIDLVFKCIELNDIAGFENGHAYDIYISRPDGYEYEICQGENGAILLWNNEKIKAKGESLILTVKENIPIECIYKSNPISFDDVIRSKSIFKMFVKPSERTVGEAEVYLRSEKHTLGKRMIALEPFSLDSMSFDALSFNTPFDRTYSIPAFLRDFKYLTFEIKSKTTKDFGLKSISFLYSLNPKASI